MAILTHEERVIAAKALREIGIEDTAAEVERRTALTTRRFREYAVRNSFIALPSDDREMYDMMIAVTGNFTNPLFDGFWTWWERAYPDELA